MKKSAKNTEEVIDIALNQKKNKTKAESIGIDMVKKMIACYEKVHRGDTE